MGVPERDERQEGLKRYLRKPWLKTWERKKIYPGIGSTEGPKQDEPKQSHTKIRHNFNSKR